VSVYVRKYFWLIHLGTVACCAILAARATGHLIDVPYSAAVAKWATPTPSSGAPAARKETLRRNIFCSTCGEAKDPNPGPGPISGDPTRSTLDLRLIATLVSEEDPSWSFAAMLEPATGRTRLYGIGTRLAGGAMISDIADRRVWLLNSGRVEFLDMTIEGGPQGSVSPPPPAALGDLSNAVRRTGDGKYEIEGNALRRTISNTAQIASWVRVVPAVVDGKPSGFTLARIRQGSMISMLGLQDGDMVHAINGHAIKTPDDALVVYTQIRRASHLTISFARRGKSMTYDYTIR
jgi:general secretion pathway protein C